MLSVIFYVKNEEENIGKRLEEVKNLADEIIIIDNGSSDKTVKIAEKYTSKIFLSPNSGFSGAHNLGAEKALGDWLFYVDADEKVTEELKQEIKQVLKNNKRLSAFAIPRRNICFGKWLHYGGYWPDYVIRLIKKDKLLKWIGALHEYPEINGKIGYLKSFFVHTSRNHQNIAKSLANTVEWSMIEAKLRFDAGHPSMTWWRFLSAMGREFYKRAVKYQGWRDGMAGFLEIIWQTFSVFITYARLWEKQNNNIKHQ